MLDFQHKSFLFAFSADLCSLELQCNDINARYFFVHVLLVLNFNWDVNSTGNFAKKVMKIEQDGWLAPA